MALNQINKLVWIVETIYKARKMTFEELNRQWMDNVGLSRGEELLKRTFLNWNIFDTFSVTYLCMNRSMRQNLPMTIASSSIAFALHLTSNRRYYGTERTWKCLNHFGFARR